MAEGTHLFAFYRLAADLGVALLLPFCVLDAAEYNPPKRDNTYLFVGFRRHSVPQSGIEQNYIAAMTSLSSLKPLSKLHRAHSAGRRQGHKSSLISSTVQVLHQRERREQGLAKVLAGTARKRGPDGHGAITNTTAGRRYPQEVDLQKDASAGGDLGGTNAVASGTSADVSGEAEPSLSPNCKNLLAEIEALTGLHAALSPQRAASLRSPTQRGRSGFLAGDLVAAKGSGSGSSSSPARHLANFVAAEGSGSGSSPARRSQDLSLKQRLRQFVDEKVEAVRSASTSAGASASASGAASASRSANRSANRSASSPNRSVEIERSPGSLSLRGKNSNTNPPFGVHLALTPEEVSGLLFEEPVVQGAGLPGGGIFRANSPREATRSPPRAINFQGIAEESAGAHASPTTRNPRGPSKSEPSIRNPPLSPEASAQLSPSAAQLEQRYAACTEELFSVREMARSRMREREKHIQDLSAKLAAQSDRLVALRSGHGRAASQPSRARGSSPRLAWGSSCGGSVGAAAELARAASAQSLLRAEVQRYEQGIEGKSGKGRTEGTF